MSRPRALVLAGPTSAGKSDTALAIAEAYDAVIVSADAMQVYRFMNIGTGKVSGNELQRAVHLGIDVRDPDERFDAASFVELAERALAEHPRVILCGGTSLYLRAFVRGLVKTPPVDPLVRAGFEALDNPHAALALVDAPLAQRLHPNDRIRVVRGLEVFEQTGQRLSDLQKAHAESPDRNEVRGLWLDRDDLNERIDARILRMIELGYVAEVQGLLERGYGRELKAMQSLGYRYLCAHLLDQLPLDEAVQLTQQSTRQFARKQRNWGRQLNFEPIDAAKAVGRAHQLAQEVFGDPGS
ncbi:MAG: tRNA (adenosine(37)-N6)-dimethylallyltransferase MiaA [Rhodobacterales bacterium]|nr:tRNA (adenosine(37)-N6)-dimethylallyltransferase MiaA [Rhodobacterales bacterium]